MLFSHLQARFSLSKENLNIYRDTDKIGEGEIIINLFDFLNVIKAYFSSNNYYGILKEIINAFTIIVDQITILEKETYKTKNLNMDNISIDCVTITISRIPTNFHYENIVKFYNYIESKNKTMEDQICIFTNIKDFIESVINCYFIHDIRVNMIIAELHKIILTSIEMLQLKNDLDYKITEIRQCYFGHTITYQMQENNLQYLESIRKTYIEQKTKKSSDRKILL